MRRLQELLSICTVNMYITQLNEKREKEKRQTKYSSIILEIK